jgi:hypothetical protein
VLRPALRLVETWMQNRPVRTVKIEVDGRVLELGHATAQQQQRLVESFLSGTSGADGAGEPSAAPIRE